MGVKETDAVNLKQLMKVFSMLTDRVSNRTLEIERAEQNHFGEIREKYIKIGAQLLVFEALQKRVAYLETTVETLQKKSTFWKHEPPT